MRPVGVGGGGELAGWSRGLKRARSSDGLSRMLLDRTRWLGGSSGAQFALNFTGKSGCSSVGGRWVHVLVFGFVQACQRDAGGRVRWRGGRGMAGAWDGRLWVVSEVKGARERTWDSRL